MSVTIDTTLQTYLAAVTIPGDFSGLPDGDFEVALGSYTSLGAFQAPDAVSINSTISVTLTGRLGAGKSFDPESGTYYLWGRATRTPDETLTRGSTRITVTTTGGVPVNPAVRYVRTVNDTAPDSDGNVDVSGGGGDVQTVAGVSPDGAGNVPLTAANVGADASGAAATAQAAAIAAAASDATTKANAAQSAATSAASTDATTKANAAQAAATSTAATDATSKVAAEATARNTAIATQHTADLAAFDAAGAAATAQAAAISTAATDATTKVAAEAVIARAAESANATAITNEATTARAAEGLKLAKASNLSDLASAATARTNLGLGTAATSASTAFDAAGAASTALTTAQAYTDTETTRATTAEGLKLAKASNLSDLASAATSRTNLGLGNVDNTSDANKPVSTAQATAIALKTTTLVPTATKTATYAPAVGDLAMMNVAGGATVLNLPSAPADKSQVGVVAIGATTAVPLTINRGGSDTISTTGATSVTLQLSGELLVLQYDAGNTRWLSVSNIKSLTALDARYATLASPALTGTPTVNGTALGTAALKDTGTTSGTIPLLGASGVLAVGRLATGTPTGLKFVRDDGTLAVPAGGATSSLYGDGSDGDVTISVNTTLARPMYYNSLTVNSGITLTASQFPIYVRNTCAVASTGVIAADGNAAANNAGGAVGAAGLLARGVTGANGAAGAGTAGTSPAATQYQYGGAGGASGSGTGGAGAAGGPVLAAPTNWFSGVRPVQPLAMHGVLQAVVAGASPVTIVIGGGSCGAAGAGDGSISGAGGGAGGNVLALAARIIANSGAIRAAGGAGAVRTAGTNIGGGGGGGGGVVLVVCDSFTGNTPTAPGGTGGAGRGTGTAGSDGSAGSVFLTRGDV